MKNNIDNENVQITDNEIRANIIIVESQLYSLNNFLDELLKLVCNSSLLNLIDIISLNSVDEMITQIDLQMGYLDNSICTWENIARVSKVELRDNIFVDMNHLFWKMRGKIETFSLMYRRLKTLCINNK